MFINEDIFGLDFPMHYLIRMHVVQRQAQLEKDFERLFSEY